MVDGNKVLAVLLLFAGACDAQCTPPACSALLPTSAATSTVGSSGLGSASFRVEVRLHGQNWASTTNSNLITIGGYGSLYLGTSVPGALYFTGEDTVTGGYGNCDIVLPSPAPSDIIYRVNRDVTNMQVRAEVFNTQTGAQIGTPTGGVGQDCVYTIASLASSSTIQSAGSSIQSATGSVGGAVGYIRWYSGSVVAGTLPTNPQVSATLGDWEFQNSGADSTMVNGSFSGLSYTAKPTYNPVCNAGSPQVVRLNSTLSLNGSASYPLNGGLSLTYAWSYFTGSDSVNQNPTITGATTSTPSTSALGLFGSADFQLIVTDSSSNSTTCSIHDGVVIAAPSGLINLTAEGLDATSQKFIGPIIMYGANRWPWADTIHTTEANLQISNLATYYTPFWSTALTGTVSVTANSNIVTGSGTTFTAMCISGTPYNGATMFLIYPGTDGLTHYMQAPVTSCTDTTHVVVSFPQSNGVATGVYPTTANLQPVFPDCTASCTGWGWSWGYDGDSNNFSPQLQYGIWTYGVAPGNYYDNAKMFYALYWRSGIDTYLTTFQNLTDEWWKAPWNDQGYSCNVLGASNSYCASAWRSLSISGVVLRALEQGGSTTYWGGLWVVAQQANYYLNTYTAGLAAPVTIDGRETGYALSMLAYCALADPNATHRSSCQGWVKSTLTNVWTPNLRSDQGNAWVGFSYSNQIAANAATSITSLGGAGSVCVINGSATVVGTSTNWTTAANGFNIAFFSGTPSTAPTTNSPFDPTVYGITVNSTTSITLSSAYAGTTGCTGTSGSNKGYVIGYYEINPAGSAGTTGLIGWGQLPYAEGMLGTAFGWAAMAMDGYDAPSAALFRTYLDYTVTWVINAMYPVNGGLYYGYGYVGCSPPATNNQACGTTETQSRTRTLPMDVMRAFAMDYQNKNSPTVAIAADTLMNQMFSKPGTGGPNPDGYYISDFDGSYTSSSPPTGSAPKWAGQLCGYEEACDMWPAVRPQSTPISVHSVTAVHSGAGVF